MKSKDARYNRKRRKAGKTDYHYETREDGKRVTKVSRRALSVSISLEAFEKLVGLAESEGIDRWKMLTRMIIYYLPKYSTHNSDSNRHQWDDKLLKPETRSVKYKGVKGAKQITYDISTTAWNKLECHKTASGKSKARIVQYLILDYTPTTPEQRAKMKEQYNAYQNHEPSWTKRKELTPSRFTYEDGEIIHREGLPPEQWTEEEAEMYKGMSMFYGHRTTL
mgnify:CR=1 FL=1